MRTTSLFRFIKLINSLIQIQHIHRDEEERKENILHNFGDLELFGWRNKVSNSGNVKAAVFPVPVWAEAIRSLPCKTGPIAAD